MRNMARKKGTVTKAGKSKFSYYLQLDGDSHYYNTKFKPKCGEGDVVGIEYNQQNDQRSQVKSIKVLESNSGGYDSSNSERNYGGGAAKSGGGTGMSNDRQDSIIWQSCQKVAAELTRAAVDAEAIASKGTPDSKAAEIKGYFDENVVSLFRDASDPKNSLTYKNIMGIEKDAGEEPSKDDWDEGGGDAWDEDDDWS
jgi:hypothetical protein